MPPLCTAGYGLATGELAYFAGAMFLYAINCVFICIATFIIVKYLKYPAAEFVDKKKESRVRTWITVVTLLMIIPSVYFAYRFLEQQRFYEQVSNFITKEFEDKGNTIVYRKTFYNTSPKRIELAFLTRKFTSEQIRDEERKLAAFGITDTRLVIRQDSAFLAQASKIQNNEVANDVSKVAAELNAKMDKYVFQTDNLYSEAKAIIPQLQSLSASKQEILSDSDSASVIPVAMYESGNALSDEQTKTLQNWLKARLKVDTIEIYRRAAK